MDYAKIINGVGLVFDLVGAFLMFYNTPKVSSITFIYPAGDPDRLSHKNKWIRLGMILLAFGFLIQLTATFLA